MKKPKKTSAPKAKSSKKKYEKPVLITKSINDKIGNFSVNAGYGQFYYGGGGYGGT